MKKQYFVWGQNNFGQLGVGSNVNKQLFTPQEAHLNLSWRSISIGQNFVVAVLNDGTLWAWGSNSSGIFGKDYKLTEFFLSPVCLSSETTWDSVACGKKHVLALKFYDNGKKGLYGWGSNSSGQLGIGIKSPYVFTPTNLISKTPTLPKFWKNIAAGSDHSLAIDEEGNVYASGNNSSTQLGLISEPIGVSLFTKIPLQGKFTKISAGDSFSVGLDDNGILWSWGNNSLGQLGIGTTEKSRKICKVDTTQTNVLDVCCGSNFTIFNSINGLYGFGSNSHGQLGVSTKKTVLTPHLIKVSGDDLSKNEEGDNIIWESLSCGDKHMAAIRHNVTKNVFHLFLAGSNEFGQIGEEQAIVNKHIKGLTTFRNKLSDTWQGVVCGYNSTFADTYPVPVSIIECSKPDIFLKENEVANLYVKAAGSQPIEYDWMVDTGTGFIQTDPPVKSDSLTINSEGNYQCKVSNFSGTVYSEIFNIKRFSAPKIIYFSPTPQNLKIDTQNDKNVQIELIVSVTGVADSVTKTTNNPTTDFYFEWFLNNKPIYSDPVLKRGRLMSSDDSLCKASDTLKLSKNFENGTYSCKISNKYGSTKSQDWFISKASLTRLIEDFPETIIITETDPTPILIAQLEGEDNSKYQWFKNNDPLENCDTKFLKLNEPGIYFLKIFNKDYEIKTKEVNFSIKEPFQIISQPDSNIFTTESSINNGVVLSVKTKGFIVKNNNIEQPNFQWYKNDIAIPNANLSNYTLTATDSSGIYFCKILNTDLKTDNCVVNVVKPPSIINQTEKFNYLNNKKHSNSLQVDFKGDLPLNVNWFKHIDNDTKKLIKKNTINLEEAFYETFSDFLSIEEIGTYSCVIENKSGKTISKPIIVSEYIPAEIQGLLINDTPDTSKCLINKQKGPHTANLQVKCVGSGEIIFKWQIKKGKIWSDLPENTNFLTTNIPGTYRCSVSNLLKPKNIKNSTQIFNVEETLPPIITLQPKSKFTISKGSSVNLTCGIDNPDDPDITYQWYLNDLPLEEANQETCIVTEEGKYYCVVENNYGQAQTNNIFLVFEEIKPLDYSQTSKLYIQKTKEFKTEGNSFFEKIIDKHLEFDTKILNCFGGINRSYFINQNNVLYGCGFNQKEELGVKILLTNVVNNLNNLNNNSKSYYLRKLYNRFIEREQTNLSRIEFNFKTDEQDEILSKNIDTWVPICSNANTLASGKNHTIILTLDGEILAAGDNSYKQYGSSFDENFEPSNLLLPGCSTLKRVIIQEAVNLIPTSVSCGLNHSLILFENGDLYGVGRNLEGQLGISLNLTSEDGNIAEWTKIATNVKKICCGYKNSFYIENSENCLVYGVGDNTYNQITEQQTPKYYSWQQITENAKDIYAGSGTVFYIDLDKNLYARGMNHFNQLGIENYNDEEIQSEFAFILENVNDVSCGEFFTLFVTDNATLAVGNNTYGQLGHGNNDTQNEIIQVLPKVEHIAAGDRHSLVLTYDGYTYSCGFNQYGQTGLEEYHTIIPDLPILNSISLKEAFSDINVWTSSNRVEFVNYLKNNNLSEFEVFNDSYFILNPAGFLFEKIKLINNNKNYVVSISNYSEIVPLQHNYVNEGYPSYWYDDSNFVYTVNILSLPQTKSKTFSFLLKMYSFDIEKGILFSILNEIIEIKYQHSVNWNDTNYHLHNPILNYCEKTNKFNVSLSLTNQINDLGLISLNISRKYLTDKSYHFVEKINAFMPWFIDISFNHQSFIKPSIMVYIDTPPVLYQNLIIKSDLLNNSTDITYQWFKNGEILTNETNSELVISNLSLSDLGQYELRATNIAGSVYENIWIRL